MLWGYAGVWPGDYGIYKADDREMAKLQFLAEHGFRSGNIPLSEMDDPRRRDEIAGFVSDNDLRMTPHPNLGVFTSDLDAIRKKTEAFLRALEACKDLLRVPIVTTGAGQVHRFMESPSLEAQLERLTEALTPLAAGCHELGCPLGIENHGDYYCSDLVQLCKAVPHLGIFLDTGNTYLIGERPIEAALAAAPFTIGTHFKDHLVNPCLSPLRFEIRGATLGEGHVGLREIYEILLEESPNPDGLVMQWELVPPKEMNALDALAKSWDFVRSLTNAGSEGVHGDDI